MGTNIVPPPSHYNIFNPSRDMANVFPTLVQLMTERIASGDFPPFVQKYVDGSIDVRAIARVVDTINCICEKTYTHEGKMDIPKVMDECGWEELPVKERTVVMAVIGCYSMFLHIRGVREIAKLDDPVPDPVREAKQILEEAFRSGFERRNRFLSWLRRLREGVENAVYTLFVKLSSLFQKGK